MSMPARASINACSGKHDEGQPKQRPACEALDEEELVATDRRDAVARLRLAAVPPAARCGAQYPGIARPRHSGFLSAQASADSRLKTWQRNARVVRCMGMPRKSVQPEDSPPPQQQLVERKCLVCEWEGEQVELPGPDPDCPWCHAPTSALQVLPLPDGVSLPDVPRGKNPFAAALGRLGARKGGEARARALSPRRRKEIARNAALARWKTTPRKKR